MTFHDIQFPPRLSFGALGGPERRTEIVTLVNGFEERNTAWQHARRRYDAGVGMQTLDDLANVVAFFEARSGQLYGFRWKDWADYKSCKPLQNPHSDDCALGVGNAIQTEFNLVKHYASGGHVYTRPITKPIAGTVQIAIDGALQRENTDFTLDTTNGRITFAHAPQQGAKVTAGFEFDVPVRFDTDRIHVSIETFQAGAIPNIPVIEIRIS